MIFVFTFTIFISGGHQELAQEMFARNIIKITESMCVQTGAFLSKRLDELVEQQYNDEADTPEDVQVRIKTNYVQTS